MNRRTAKERALTHGFLLIDSYIRGGSDTLYETYPEEDADKINAELDQIAQRLYERAADLREGTR